MNTEPKETAGVKPSLHPPVNHSQREIIYSDIDPLEDSSLSIHFDDFGDDFIENNSGRLYFGHYIVRKRELCVICTGILLFAACVALSISVGIVMHPSHNNAIDLKSEPCEEQQCFQLSSFMIPSMNRNVDPCLNFGEFSCGGFATVNPLPAGEPYNGMLDITLHKMDEKLRAILDNSDLGDDLYSQELSYLAKTKQLYRSCTRDVYGIRYGGKPLLDIIESIGGWSALNNWQERFWDFSSTIQTISGKYLVEVFFSVVLVPDRFNDGQNRLQLSIPHFSEAQTLVNNPWEPHVLTEYKKFINATASLLIENEQQRKQILLTNKQQSIKNFLSDVIYMENRVYKILEGGTDTDVQEVSIQSLNEAFPWIDWLKYFEDITPGVQITKKTRVYINCLDYLSRVSIILQSISKRTLHNFLIWRLIREFVPYLSHDFQQIFAEYNSVLPNQGFHSVGERCINFLKISVMREAVLSFLFQNKVDENFQKQISEVLINVKNALFNQVWLDDPKLKIDFEKKLNQLKFVVESDILSNTKFLNGFYNKLEVTNTYFTNILNIREFAKLKISDVLTLKKVQMPLPFNNNFRLMNYNTVFIPMYYLYPPYFDINYPRHVIYSRFGTIVAQIILNYITQNSISKTMQIEDNYFSFYDGNSSEMMNYIKDCTTKHLHSLTINGSVHRQEYSFPLRLDPNIFLEILAVKASFEAYIDYQRMNGKDKTIPGLGKFTLQQSFFLSMAQMMCENVDPIFLRTAASYGTPLGNNLINVIVDKLHPFGTAYECTKPSPKSPDYYSKQCRF